MPTELDQELSDKQLKKLRRFAYPSCMPKRSIPKRICPRSKITILMIILSVFCLLGCLVFSIVLFNRTPATLISIDLWITLFYIFGGIFAVILRYNEINQLMVNRFYALSIISLVLSAVQFGIHFAIMTTYRFYY
ncbi:hypothetical protein TrispH2_008329 [Trichoplax sp. H2]|nr:hypothetical protein TrispH2_008329 [Trichoplax sp. H2]|eukprot:RDD39320.1 hypothetical protein TrispH2_008329 [Trichoplax sp. H2]